MNPKHNSSLMSGDDLRETYAGAGIDVACFPR